MEIRRTEKMPTPPMSSEMPATEKKMIRQLRSTVTTFPRSLLISFPTFSMCTSLIPLCARTIVLAASSSASIDFSGSLAFAITYEIALARPNMSP